MSGFYSVQNVLTAAVTRRPLWPMKRRSPTLSRMAASHPSPAVRRAEAGWRLIGLYGRSTRCNRMAEMGRGCVKTPWSHKLNTRIQLGANKGQLIGRKPPLKLKGLGAIRIHLQRGKRTCNVQSGPGRRATRLWPR